MTARYSNDLHKILNKLVLLSEVATLSVAHRLRSPSMDFNVSLEVASHNTGDHVQQRDSSSWESTCRDIVNLLEQWDEPVQSKQAEIVSLKKQCDRVYFQFFLAPAYLNIDLCLLPP
jgi:hypothetical protein